MTLDMWLAVIILLAAIILFVTEWLRVDVVALGVMTSLMLTGLLDPAEAISGFSNPAVLTIASLFIVGGAVMQTGLASAIGEKLLTIAGNHPVRLMTVIMLSVALMSSFMSSTGTVALLLPAIISLARSAKISPSKLLLPLAYGSLLGGAMTLIGTPPNIIVADLLRDQGEPTFGFFDFTPIGIALLIAGILYMLFLGRRMIPDYQPQQDLQRVETPEELVDIYRLPDNIYKLRVRRSSNIIGKSVSESQLGQKFKITILDIQRPARNREVAKLGERSLVLQSNGYDSLSPSASTVLNPGDILVVQGESSEVAHASAQLNLGVMPKEAEDEVSLISNEVGISEILLPPRSSLIGKTIVETKFGSQYKLTVLGIRRPGVEEKLDLKETHLQFGDTLLVQGSWSKILELKQRKRDFVVIGQPEQMITAPTKEKAPIALLIMAGMVLLMVTNWLSIVEASMLAALAVIVTKCLTIDDAYEAINWKSLVLIAGMLPMSIALERVGIVDLVANWLTASLGAYGPMVVLGGLFLTTSLFTQILSNTATTVLVAPIALAAAHNLNINPLSFMMGVAVAASMAFATPVASPVNTLVMGAGNYKFTDYIKVGGIMIIISLVVALLVIPIFFPFTR
jgi:di/tricarboxylate transporter